MTVHERGQLVIGALQLIALGLSGWTLYEVHRHGERIAVVETQVIDQAQRLERVERLVEQTHTQGFFR